MTRMSADLAQRMQQVFAEVSRLIMALQAGDSTRQRLERVNDVLACADRAGDPATESLLVDLARALADAARTDAEDEVGVSIAALDVVRRNAEQAMQAARAFYFAQAGHGRDGSAGPEGGPDVLEESLLRVRRHLVAMRGRADDLRGRLDVILRHEATIRQIAQQVRLSGLNAVLICAKLGEEGRSLRELAQWLRMLTDESDAIVQRLQVDLGETRARTRETGQAGVDRLEAALSGFIGDAEALNGAMGQIDSVVTETARGFDAAGRELPLRLGHAAGRLDSFRLSLTEVKGLTVTLALRRMHLPAPVLPLVAGSDAAAELDALRRRYTMQQERAIHDGIVGVETAPAAPAAPPQAAADDTLDDILF